MKARTARERRMAWFSARSIICHLVLTMLLPALVIATRWQVERAMSGNTLSYIYSAEWPAFALVALWAWWQIIHLPPAGDEAWEKHPTAASWLKWDRRLESPELRSYNRYLLELHRSGRFERWTRTSLPPAGRNDEIEAAGTNERR